MILQLSLCNIGLLTKTHISAILIKARYLATDPTDFGSSFKTITMETAITEKITQDQRKQIIRFVEDRLDKLGFTKEEAQEIIENGGTLTTEIETLFKKLSIADNRFGSAIKEFEITVPADYNHDKQIDQFGKKTKKLKNTYYYNDAFTSKNFAKATNKLEAGKTYLVKIFPILKSVTSEDCMNFLRKQRAILVGGQGLSLAQDLKKDEFPVGKWTVSFDEKDALWEDADGDRRVPYVCRYSGGDWYFRLGNFGNDWYSDYCLLCFCDK